MHASHHTVALLLQPVLFLPCVAQPTLTAGQMARQVGDVFNFRACGPIAFPATGEGLTWDYADVSGSSCGGVSIVEPAGTSGEPYFPTATTVAQDLDLADATYYGSTPTQEIWLGHFATKHQSSFCTDPRTDIRYPFTYGSAYTDSMVCAETDGYFRTRFSEAVTTCEGYGTVVLPYGTFTDCLLLHRHTHYTDVYDQEPTLYGEGDLFTFVKPGIAVPLFSLEKHTTFFEDENNIIEEGSTLLDQLSTGVLAMREEAGGVLSPNPAHDAVVLQRASKSPAQVSLLAVDGRVLSSARLASGSTTHRISLTEVPAGIYLVQVFADGVGTTLRVVKE